MRTKPLIHDLCLSVLHRYVYVGETFGWRVYVDPHGLSRPEVFIEKRKKKKRDQPPSESGWCVCARVYTLLSVMRPPF